MKYDNLLKTIFFDAMPALLRLLKCAPVVEYLSIEFPRTHKMVADVVALLKDGRILHLEFQVKNDPEMHWRMYHYYGTIQQRWPKAEVLQVVVYLGGDPLTMVAAVKRTRCKFWYDILNLQEVPARVFLKSPRSAERALAAVCKSARPRETIRRVLASWKELPENELHENIVRLTTLSQLRENEIMAGEEVERMPFDLDITENAIYRLGAAEGRLEGAREMLSRILRGRFGPLSRATRKRISQAKPEQIEQWIGQFEGAGSVSDLFK